MNETSLSRLPSLREAGSRSEAEGSSAEAEISTEESATSGFRVNLEVYSGPFDALLGMIANNRLELTEVSLSSITEEFLTYVRGLDFTKNMDEASAFLDIASILVEAKSVAILPAAKTASTTSRASKCCANAICCSPDSSNTAPTSRPQVTSGRVSPPTPADSRTRRPWTRALPPCCLSWYGR